MLAFERARRGGVKARLGILNIAEKPGVLIRRRGTKRVVVNWYVRSNLTRLARCLDFFRVHLCRSVGCGLWRRQQDLSLMDADVLSIFISWVIVMMIHHHRHPLLAVSQGSVYVYYSAHGTCEVSKEGSWLQQTRLLDEPRYE